MFFLKRVGRPILMALVAVALLFGPSRWQPRAAAEPRVLPNMPGSYHYYDYYYYYNRGHSYYPGYSTYYNPSAYNYANPYASSPYYNANPYGGYLNGAADVINSQGQYLVSTQQAYLLKEQVKAAQLQNRRGAWEEWLWEKAHTPTLNEQREKIQQEELRRSLHSPPATEIWSGKALNDILLSLQQLQNKGHDGPTVPLASDLLKNVNVTTGKGPADTGLLREAGKLVWPLGLQILPQSKELRDRIDTLLAQAKKQCLAGQVDAALLTELRKSVSQLRSMLVSRVSEYSFNDYTEAKRFLRQLDDAVMLLQQPDAGHYVSGKYSAQGSNVKDLVNYLTKNGLHFGPAIGGEEASYTALYNALVEYNDAASSRLVTK